MPRSALVRPARRPRTNRRLLDTLESRLLMHAAAIDHGSDHPHILNLHDLGAIESTTATGTGPDLGITTSGPLAIADLQKYHSRPGATATIYLDFNGFTGAQWGQYTVTTQTAWSRDTDVAAFSDSEQGAIYEIWARLAEKFSPFNIDVTTEDPGNRTAYKTLAIVFSSDSGAWLGAPAGGVAYVNSFRGGGSAGNTAFVFPRNLGNTAKNSAEAAAHEAAHAFGLDHQSAWNGTTKTEYNPGNSLVAPIMGNSYSAQRGLWWKGTPSASATALQDDLALLASSANRFGYAPDDHASTLAAGTALTVNGTALSGYGVIEKMADADVFSFTAHPGTASFTVDPATYGAMLNLKLDLYDDASTLIASANSATFSEKLSLTLAAGTYKLVVASNGSYGDIGQYRISATLPEPPVTPQIQIPTAPTGLAAATADGAIALAWIDTNTAQTAVIVQRSTDGGITFTDHATLAPFTREFTDTAVTPGATYAYRVYAVNTTLSSELSNVTTVTLAPAPPAGFAASAASTTAITLTWSDVSGETGYRLERSADGATFSTLTTLDANVTTYTDEALTPATSYTYRLVALNAGGDSPASPVASATTNAPLRLAGDANADGAVNSFDLNILAANWLSSNAVTFATGDFNEDGTVDSFDLNILASNWLKTLTPVATPTVTSTTETTTTTASVSSTTNTASRAKQHDRRDPRRLAAVTSHTRLHRTDGRH